VIITYDEYLNSFSSTIFNDITFIFEVREKATYSTLLDINTRNLNHSDKAPETEKLSTLISKHTKNKLAYKFILNHDNINQFTSMISIATTNPNIKEIIIEPQNVDIIPYAQQIKDKFYNLQAYQEIKIPIYFSPYLELAEQWESRTQNPYRGPRYVDIDFSNFCTHNCVFCGLYNDDAKKNLLTKNISKEKIKELYKGQIATESFHRIINEIPFQLDYINVGGAGEPTAHPNFFEFISELRLRNYNINIFSHFSYMTPERIETLSQLGGAHPMSLHFILNISAGTGETYNKIRPNQSPEVFDKIINLLKLATQIRQQSGRGIFFTYMSVTNLLNYHEIPLMVYRALEIGAHEVWIKPIEVHGIETLNYLIGETHQLSYLINLKLGLYFADYLSVKVMHRHVIELNLAKYNDKLDAHFKITSFNSYIKKSIIMFPELAQYFTNALDNKTTQRKIETHREDFNIDADFSDNVQNAGIPLKLYDKVPCNIGREYIRFGVNGEVWPCCISKYPISHNGSNGILTNWHSSKLAHFRKVTENLPNSKLHRTDPDWAFCQQCSHTEINQKNFSETI